MGRGDATCTLAAVVALAVQYGCTSTTWRAHCRLMPLAWCWELMSNTHGDDDSSALGWESKERRELWMRGKAEMGGPG